MTPHPPGPAGGGVAPASSTAAADNVETAFDRREDDVFRVFISFSSKNNRDREVFVFVKDLKKWFAEFSGLEEGVEFDFFLSDDQDRQGVRWPSELNEELNRADVLMPMMSPHFFRAEWCAQEWGAFDSRVRRLRRAKAVPDRQITTIPVVWVHDELPPVARDLRIGWGQGGSSVPGYREDGLNLLREDEPAQYRKVVQMLAQQLALLFDDGERLPVLRRPIDVRSAPLAFPPRKGATRCSSWQYYLVHASVSDGDLAHLEKNGDPNPNVSAGGVHPPAGTNMPSRVPVRTARHHYGENAARWDPFREVDETENDSRVRRAIEDVTWSHRMKPVSTWRKLLDFKGGEPTEVKAGRNDVKAIVIVALDSWLLQFAEWLGNTKWVVELGDTNILLLAPKAQDQQFIDSWPLIENELQRIVDATVGVRDTLRYRTSTSADRLAAQLQELLPAACLDGRPGRLANGQPILPTGRPSQ